MMDFMGTLVNVWILYFKMEIVGSLKLLCIPDFNIATLEKVWSFDEFDCFRLKLLKSFKYYEEFHILTQ